MSRLTVPIVACVIGEGGSGGAIAIALADRVLMQENAMYSVISPEGCAAILWRDGGEKVKAAAALKPDAVHTLELGVIDAIVPEPEGGAHTNWDEAARLLGEALQSSLEDLSSIPERSFGAVGATASARWASMRRPQLPQIPQGCPRSLHLLVSRKRRFSGPGPRGNREA